MVGQTASLAQLLTSSFLKHCLPLASKHHTLVFFLKHGCLVSVLLTCFSSPCYHTSHESHSHEEGHTHTLTVTQSHSQRFSETGTGSQNHKVIDTKTQAHVRPLGSLPSLRLCTCLSLPRGPPFSLNLQPESGPTWVSLLCVPMEQNCVLLSNPRQCPTLLFERKGYVGTVFLSPMDILL